MQAKKNMSLAILRLSVPALSLWLAFGCSILHPKQIACSADDNCPPGQRCLQGYCGGGGDGSGFDFGLPTKDAGITDFLLSLSDRHLVRDASFDDIQNAADVRGPDLRRITDARPRPDHHAGADVTAQDAAVPFDSQRPDTFAPDHAAPDNAAPDSTVCTAPAPDNVVYVNAAATEWGDGSSWHQAVRHIQQGLRLAPIGGQVWIAGGDYRQEAGQYAPYGYDGEYNNVIIRYAVQVYGGFAGDESCLEQRDLSAGHTTRITPPYAHSVYGAVVIISGSPVRFDGITVTDGRNNYNCSGGGIKVYGDEVEIHNCVISWCTAESELDYDSTCSQGEAGEGGGMYTRGDNVKVVNTVFAHNEAESYGYASDGFGGAIYNGGNLEVINCTFVDNKAIGSYYYGRGHAISGDRAVSRNSIFWGEETSGILGGGESYNSCGHLGTQGDPKFVNGYQLASDSPCIDRADGDFAPATDRYGNARYDAPSVDPNEGVGTPDYVDIGAHEYRP